MNRVCSGCDIVFNKVHLLLQHRRSFRCGGEWNECVYVPTHKLFEGKMIYVTRIGNKFDPMKSRLVDPTIYRGTEGHFMRYIHRAQRKKVNRHKGRTPGIVRNNRLPGGSSFRNNWE